MARRLPDDRVITDRDVRERAMHDESGAPGVLPDAVVRAESAEEIAIVVRECAARGVPVTARGAGTGKTGGAVPARGGIVLSTDRMRDVIEIDRTDGVAV